ncbi:hypothetical protein GW17_00061420 [Ensete ventricosum]|nr:hypothetical protein GW17_00061420 [Ensete ventricosum]
MARRAGAPPVKSSGHGGRERAGGRRFQSNSERLRCGASRNLRATSRVVVGGRRRNGNEQPQPHPATGLVTRARGRRWRGPRRPFPHGRGPGNAYGRVTLPPTSSTDVGGG